MMRACPHCGFNLKYPLQDGITTCLHCSRVFDSNPFNRVLSAGWMVRRKNIDNESWLISVGYTEEEAKLAIYYVFDLSYTHEDFIEVLETNGVSKVYVPNEY